MHHPHTLILDLVLKRAARKRPDCFQEMNSQLKDIILPWGEETANVKGLMRADSNEVSESFSAPYGRQRSILVL